MRDPALVMPAMGVRRLVGGLGLLFPAILVLGHLLFVGPAVLPSLSDYYHSGMRDVFVGVLFAIALALLVYRGHDPIDLWLTDIAAATAVLTALLPTDATDVRTAVGICHLVSAGIFLLTLAGISLFLFTRTDRPEAISASKRRRNRVFVGCGWTIVGCLAGCGVYIGLLADRFPSLAAVRPVLVLETCAVMAFGCSWLIKGQALFADQQAV